MITIDEQLTFGEMLRRRRVAAGLTQEALAEKSGLSYRTISDLERGVNQAPRRENLRALVEALGLSSAERTEWEAVRRTHAASAATSKPTAHRTAKGRQNILPLQLTSFIGRERELVEVERLLRSARLVTLTGTGGCGKTRLALEVVARVRESFADGVRFVALAPISDPRLVTSAIAQALGVPDVGTRPLLDSLKMHLREKEVLLVLDNFEQVGVAAALVAELLATCAGLTVLVTSRAPLRMSGEHQFPVPPLALPDPNNSFEVEAIRTCESVALFVERASAVEPRFHLDAENAAAVAQL
jgi:transcriptional regulator with XRE-family HTH domain